MKIFGKKLVSVGHPIYNYDIEEGWIDGDVLHFCKWLFLYIPVIYYSIFFIVATIGILFFNMDANPENGFVQFLHNLSY